MEVKEREAKKIEASLNRFRKQINKEAGCEVMPYKAKVIFNEDKEREQNIKEDNVETETKGKKNPDYFNSAVRLCHPRAVEEKLLTILQMNQSLANLNAQAQALIPVELRAKIAETEGRISEANKVIRELIDQQGSYQDVENGRYALKMRKISKVYHAGPFLELYPEFAPMVIVQTIDSKAFELLVKADKIAGEAWLKERGIISETFSFAYVVK